MPSLKISVDHQLEKDEAVERLKGLFEKVKNKFGDQIKDLQEEWNENALKFGFSTYGFNIKGDMAVEEGQVNLDGNLPFAAMMFKGKIEKEVRETLERTLA
jgi:hypothetical protein